MASVQETLGSVQWVMANFCKLRDVFPTTRTLVSQHFMIRTGWQLKVMGVEWRDEDELAWAMIMIHRIGAFTEDRKGDFIWVERADRTVPPPYFFDMSEAQVRVNRILRAQPSSDVVEIANSIIQRARAAR